MPLDRLGAVEPQPGVVGVGGIAAPLLSDGVAVVVTVGKSDNRRSARAGHVTRRVVVPVDLRAVESPVGRALHQHGHR